MSDQGAKLRWNDTVLIGTSSPHYQKPCMVCGLPQKKHPTFDVDSNQLCHNVLAQFYTLHNTKDTFRKQHPHILYYCIILRRSGEHKKKTHLSLS